MTRAVAVFLTLVIAICVSSCTRDAETPVKASESAPSSTAKVAVSPRPEKPADALASITTNFPGVVADVTEFRRKGPVLTALVRLRNQGSALASVDIRFSEAYVMEAGTKKYQVLKDEDGAYIASAPARVYEGLKDGGTQIVWMKFPAPTPEVHTATLVVPGMSPFEDLSIQDQ